MDLTPTAHLAFLGGVQQLGCKAEHPRCNRPAFFLVAVEQRIGSASENRSQLPAKIVGVLDAGIKTLATRWWMNVSGVTNQERATDTVAIS
jgi:hypothetical protein